jgi:hypothetical protein
MDEPGWFSLYEAALEVERSFGISRAVARKRLRQACAEQLITSMKAPYDGGYDEGHQLPFEYWSPVAPSEWRQREVDYDGPDKDGCETVVMIREDDYRHWLNVVMIREDDYRHWLNGATKNNGQKVTNRGSPKRRLAEQAIKQIEKEVADWLEQQGVPPISRETILRAAGKK